MNSRDAEHSSGLVITQQGRFITQIDLDSTVGIHDKDGDAQFCIL